MTDKMTTITTMTMRKLLPSLLCMQLCACKEPVPRKQEQRLPDSASIPSADTMIPGNDTIIANQITSWSRFEDYAGHYAGEVELLQKQPLNQRYRQLLGKDTTLFLQRLQVAPPIELDGTILYNDGCKPHNCASDEAAIAINMTRDIIYIGIAVNGRVKLYAENQDTAFPQRLLEWKQKFR
ncbi:hypothetical protein F0L74_26710 [Chitinophaga agrisoli]|uniref:Uncharacterized protein n=1 Tax=Chitinophaga agrisoli TaxID=2607653 RepID=A0A5B2VLK4_9BACT|nr:hypothetical protein [Chitinophaga agrisoli]KAA2239785.1 hypothetical protein F0L74_26710 [Chitinophaga agrisoli]